MSPLARANAVTACGPPSTPISRLPAPLSPDCSIATQSCSIVMPVSTWLSVIGEPATIS